MVPPPNVMLRRARGVSGEDEAGSGRDQGEVWWENGGRRFGGDEIGRAHV